MESVDNPWGCGISTGGGKKLCLCLFCIKAAESGWAAGKNLGHPRRTGGRKMQERRRPVQAGRRRGARRVQEAAPYRHPGSRDRAASVPPLQKCRDLFDERRRGRSQTGPRAFARGARIQDVTLIRPFGPPSPLKGEGLRAAKGRSYREGEIFWDGRVRTPAPTKFGESSGFSVGADDLGGPRAHSVRPYG